MIKKQSWWQLLAILSGGALSLPVIMVGHILCQKYGWAAALLTIGVGNAFLLGMGIAFSLLSTTRSQSTVENAIYYFGGAGRTLFTLLMIITMVGWFAIQLNVMVASILPLLSLSPLLLTIAVGAVLSITMCYGMRAISLVAAMASPLLALTLVYIVYSLSGTAPAAAPIEISWLAGLSAVIGSTIGVVIDLPTFFQHARSKRDGIICICLLYGLVLPCIQGVGIYLFSLSNGLPILDVLRGNGGWVWGIWVSMFLFLSGWATNNANLYSAVISSYSLFTKGGNISRALILGTIGTIVACFNPFGNLGHMLEFFSVTIGNMGAVMLVNYMLKGSIQSHVALTSWAIGVAVGLSAMAFNWSITGSAVFDAFLISAIFQWLIGRNKRYAAVKN